MKTKSSRTRIKEISWKTVSRSMFMIGIPSLIILTIGIIVYVYLFNRTVFDDPFLNFFIALFLVMMITGFFGGIIFMLIDNYFDELKWKINYFDVRKFDIEAFSFFIFGMLAIAGIQFGFNLTQAITSLEQFLFYVFAAVAEEYFYRFFITTAVFIIIKKYFNVINYQRKYVAETMTFIISATISVIFTSAFFYLSHVERYGETPLILVGIFLGSVVLTTIYIATKKILICLIIHLIINFVAFGSLLITL